MNTKEDQPTQSIFEGAKHLLQGLPKVAAGVVGLSGFAYLIGWVYARSYFSVFGAEWLTTEISVLTLMGYSWVGWIKVLSFTPNPPYPTLRLAFFTIFIVTNERMSLLREMNPYLIFLPVHNSTFETFSLMLRISILYNSPLERGDTGVCKSVVTHPRPLFLEGSLKVAANGSLI